MTNQPAILIISDRTKVETLVAAAGKPFSAKLAETIQTVEKNSGTGNPLEFDLVHDGRTVSVFVYGFRPQSNLDIAAALMVRVAAISTEAAPANESILRTTKSAVRSALTTRSLWSADRMIRELGSVDGFPTQAYFGNGQPAITL